MREFLTPMGKCVDINLGGTLIHVGGASGHPRRYSLHLVLEQPQAERLKARIIRDTAQHKENWDKGILERDRFKMPWRTRSNGAVVFPLTSPTRPVILEHSKSPKGYRRAMQPGPGDSIEVNITVEPFRNFAYLRMNCIWVHERVLWRG